MNRLRRSGALHRRLDATHAVLWRVNTRDATAAHEAGGLELLEEYTAGHLSVFDIPSPVMKSAGEPLFTGYAIGNDGRTYAWLWQPPTFKTCAGAIEWLVEHERARPDTFRAMGATGSGIIYRGLLVESEAEPNEVMHAQCAITGSDADGWRVDDWIRC